MAEARCSSKFCRPTNIICTPDGSHSEDGGANILPLAYLADVSAVSRAFRLLTSPDPAFCTVAELSLKRTASKYLNTNEGWKEAAEYLSGDN
ncbi:hypothetical protein FOCC_FOCC015315, partial [Frankliniella occidentalis]